MSDEVTRIDNTQPIRHGSVMIYAGKATTPQTLRTRIFSTPTEAELSGAYDTFSKYPRYYVGDTND